MVIPLNEYMTGQLPQGGTTRPGVELEFLFSGGLCGSLSTCWVVVFEIWANQHPKKCSTMSSEFPWVSGFNTSPGSPAPVPRPHRWGGPSWARPALVPRAAGELRARPGSLQHETWTMGDVHGKGTPLKKRYPVPIGSPINWWIWWPLHIYG